MHRIVPGGPRSVLLTLTMSLLAINVAATGKANTWELLGETGASAQQLFLGVSFRFVCSRARRCCAGMDVEGNAESFLILTQNQTATTVYIVDKTENNPATVGGHPACARASCLGWLQWTHH